MTNLIVGIHGLANKPDKDVLARWWRDSIAEGLDRNESIDSPSFDFEMVYWADQLYRYPLHQDEAYNFDKLYNGEPYREAGPGELTEYREGFLDSVRAKVQDWGGSIVDYAHRKFGMESVGSWLLGKLLKDLAFYYDEERKIGDPPRLARTVLDETLEKELVPHAGKKIMVIAHSMGSIIAYNVLRDLGQKHGNVHVADFVTIGSPLGLPYVKAQIVRERGYDPRVRTPTCVKDQWVNYADKKDPVALDIRLRDDYTANASDVRVTDDLVSNTYWTPGKGNKHDENHHKSYGYLRTPEVSRHIRAFLGL